MPIIHTSTLRSRIRAFVYRWSDELIGLAVFILLIICSLEPTGV